jgi:hypothetical protein
LAQDFFTVNTLDKSSGLISLSYSGDPARFVDCGVFTVNGVTMQAAAASLKYRSDAPLGPPVVTQRTMALEGRINLVIQPTEAAQTRATVSTRYVLTRDATARNAVSGILVGSMRHQAQFNSGETGSFPAVGNHPPVQCVSTGLLERDLMARIE